MKDLSTLGIKTVLLVDDDEQSLERSSRVIADACHVQVTSARHASQALALANDRLFDFVAIDVSMNFQGSTFGGLQVYKQLRGRYGHGSLIAYSKYITDEVLERYDLRLRFVEHAGDPLRFVERVTDLMAQLRPEQACFVAMPFGAQHLPVLDVVRGACLKAGYRCIRVDEQPFTDSIIERVYHEIQDAKVVVFVATARNPNAFLECGYAIALRKEVITLADSVHDLPFNVRGRNTLAYAGEPRSIESALGALLVRLASSPTP